MTRIEEQHMNILKISAIFYNLYHISTDVIKHDPTKKLYFGISAEKKSIFFNNYRFWMDFIWAHMNIKEAKDIAGPNGLIFEIELSFDDPHPNWKSPFSWTLSSNEDQVWVFPYFAFEIISKEKFEDYTLIKIKQDLNNSVLSISKNKIKQVKNL